MAVLAFMLPLWRLPVVVQWGLSINVARAVGESSPAFIRFPASPADREHNHD